MKRIQASTKLIAALVIVAIICLSAVYFLFVAEANPIKSRVLSPPSLVSPINRAIVTSTPELRWNPARSVSTFEIQIIYETSMKVVCTKKGLSPLQTSYQLQANEALSSGVYHWRVRAVDNAGTPGEWSTTGTFKVE
jgi:hypothetical protein